LESVPNPYSTPPGAEGGLPRVSFPAEEDGWLLLTTGTYELLRYEDGSWRSVGYPLPAELGYPKDICFPAVNEGWVAGSNGFAHYKDGAWEFVPGPQVRFLDFTAPNDGWAVSRGDTGRIYHYDGASWTVSYTAQGYTTLGIGFCTPDNGWASLMPNAGGYGFLLRYDNNAWHKVIGPNRYGGLFPCPFTSDEAWFQGYVNQNGKITKTTWHWTTALNVVPTSFGRIKALFAEEEIDREEGIDVPSRYDSGNSNERHRRHGFGNF
jgi:hypothetical protein